MIDRVEETSKRPPPIMKLVGTDGNAFAILGRVLRALREAGWSQAEIDTFKAEATAGNYDHLLATVMKHLDVE